VIAECARTPSSRRRRRGSSASKTPAVGAVERPARSPSHSRLDAGTGGRVVSVAAVSAMPLCARIYSGKWTRPGAWQGPPCRDKRAHAGPGRIAPTEARSASSGSRRLQAGERSRQQRSPHSWSRRQAVTTNAMRPPRNGAGSGTARLPMQTRDPASHSVSPAMGSIGQALHDPRSTSSPPTAAATSPASASRTRLGAGLPDRGSVPHSLGGRV
jgi:hypothetical protein